MLLGCSAARLLVQQRLCVIASHHGHRDSIRTEAVRDHLICSGGDENVDAKLYVTLTDNTNQSNTSNTLSLTSDSQAKGVGIQVFKDSTQLGFGPDSAAVGNKNQWYASTTGNGFFSISLQARFVQTSQIVTPGPAKGRMTFTISYQ